MATLQNVMSQVQAPTEEVWEEVFGYESKPKYSDDNAYATIIKKVMSAITGLTLSGEMNSQYIEFVMDRYQDGIDLSNKAINICYKISGTEQGNVERPINVFRNKNQIKFGWIVPYEITKNVCTIELGVYCAGKEYEKDYIWKSRPSSYSIEEGFVCANIIEPPQEIGWFDKLIIRVNETDNKVAELNKKVDNAISSVTADWEVADIRIGADGKTYDTAGNAVRGQINQVKTIIENHQNYWEE